VSLPNLHAWDLEPSKAIELQTRLRDRLILSWDNRNIRTVAGVDVSIKSNWSHAAIVVLRFPDLTPIDAATAEMPCTFPYIPGLLAFREGPVALTAWRRLRTKPDLLIFDGQGIAHPRGMGLAAHLGLWLERPTIGVAKSRLYGLHTDPGLERGDSAELLDERESSRVIGMVLRTRTNVRPVYVSPGHLIDVPHAVDFVLKCCTRYRLPEPTRWAHRVAGMAHIPLNTG